jgi:hypothetical protein
MTNTISIVAYKRPLYFEQLLRSLVRNDLNNWRIFIQIEPSSETSKMLKCIEQYLADFNTTVFTNKKILGARNNPHVLLEKVFDSGSNLNIHLEEDIIISSDITKLAQWYSHQDLTSTMCLNLVSNSCFSSGVIFSKEQKYSNYIIKSKLFNSIGLIFNRNQWFKHIKKNWMNLPQDFCNHNGIPLQGWDIALYDYLLHTNNLHTMSCLYPRATHTGIDGGEHCRKNFFLKAWDRVSILEGKKTTYNYKIAIYSDIDSQNMLSLLYLWEEMAQSLITIKKYRKAVKKYTWLFNIAIFMKQHIPRSVKKIIKRVLN